MQRRPSRALGWGQQVRSRKNDPEESLQKVFAEQRARLRQIARRAGRQDEEDVVQDAFLQVVERTRQQKVFKLDNLLSHVVRCLAIDRLRRRGSQKTFTSVEAGDRAVDAAADPERGLMGAQRLERVLAAIEAMPPRRREVFLMHRVEELTYIQIARRLGVDIKTVEKHVHLAMRQLSDTDD